jgi:hypothetical protein
VLVGVYADVMVSKPVYSQHRSFGPQPQSLARSIAGQNSVQAAPTCAGAGAHGGAGAECHSQSSGHALWL